MATSMVITSTCRSAQALTASAARSSSSSASRTSTRSSNRRHSIHGQENTTKTNSARHLSNIAKNGTIASRGASRSSHNHYPCHRPANYESLTARTHQHQQRNHLTTMMNNLLRGNRNCKDTATLSSSSSSSSGTNNSENMVTTAMVLAMLTGFGFGGAGSTALFSQNSGQSPTTTRSDYGDATEGGVGLVGGDTMGEWKEKLGLVAAAGPKPSHENRHEDVSSKSQLEYALQGGMIRVMETPASIGVNVGTATSSSNGWDKKTEHAMARGALPKTYDVSVRALKGSRISMEDEYYISSGGHFAAVFDGHGGGGVSNYLREKLYGSITKHLSAQQDDDESEEDVSIDDSPQSQLQTNKNHYPSTPSIIKAMKAAFNEVENQVLQNQDFQYQGSTAVAVYITEDYQSGKRTLVSANVGDSRAILSRSGRALDLTRDHKPNDDQERERILSMGETIEWDGYCGLHRVRNLSLSRAIGDKFAKPVVSGEVEIQLVPLHDGTANKSDITATAPHTIGEGDPTIADCSNSDEFILLASDGLWDVMTSQDCVDYVHKRLNAGWANTKNLSSIEQKRQKYTKRKNMSRFVANEALRRGSGDNVCVVIVWLKE